MIRNATTEDVLKLGADGMGMERAAERWLPEAAAARAIEHDGKLVAVLGLDVLWPGVGQVWMASAPGLNLAEGYTLVRSIRALIKEIMARHEIHRLQSYVNGMSVKNQAFNELIGFRPESVMFRAAPDKTDLILYVYLGG